MSKSPVSRTDEFETFKKGKGADINKIFNDNKITLKEKKKIALDLAITLNETKQKIDDTRGLLDVKSNERAKGEDRDSTENIVIDQEEYILLNTMKTLKSTYRNDFESLKQIRQEIDYCSRLVDQCRQKLMTEFEVWFESCFGGNEVVVDDVVDVAEKFDKLQNERMSHEDPDSLPFYNARKTTERKKVQKAAKRPMRN